jgi:predicted nucleic acid-binding protein
MKVVSNTSPVIWLDKIGRLDLLRDLYDTIYTSPGTLSEIVTFPQVDQTFVQNNFFVPQAVIQEKRRFDKLVRRWCRKLKLGDVADIEVLITQKFYCDADEMLFANKEAEFKLGKHGQVRDIANLYEIAEEKGVFERKDSLKYLNELLAANFRTPYIRELIAKLS